MPTREELDEDIDLLVTNKTEPDSLTPEDEGTALKLVADYVDQQAPTKTQGNVALSETPSVLPNDVNMCSFNNGIAYLPTTTVIGKEIIVFAVANISVRANVANTNFLSVARFQTFTNSVDVPLGKGVRFTYVGLGYWQAEFLNPDKGILNSTTSALSAGDLNTAYPNATTPIGFIVFCPSITGQGLEYKKTGTSSWVQSEIATVS